VGPAVRFAVRFLLYRNLMRDGPTTVNWFSSFISRIAVSHDRAFLRALCEEAKTMELPCLAGSAALP
jgi:hypothetical protein